MKITEAIPRRRRLKDSERADIDLLRLVELHGQWPVNKRGLRASANRMEKRGLGFVSLTDAGAIFVLRRRAA